MEGYGKELIIDLHNCDIYKFSRENIEKYLIELCDDIIDMERSDLHWWDYEEDGIEEYEKAPPHLKGVSCVQFIMTSTIVIHTLEDLKIAFINVFSCKEFDVEIVTQFTKKYFDGDVVTKKEIARQ